MATSGYVEIMEQYKQARRSGRENDADALLKKARELHRKGKVSREEFEAGAYI